MELLKIKADVREVGRKGPNRRLRGQGLIPSILYGHGESGMALSVPSKEFTLLMKGAAGINALVELEIAQTIGATVKHEPVVVMLKDYQVDTISHKITHIDFFKIDMKKRVTVKVPVHLTGKAAGIAKGGLVEQTKRELEVKCLPGSIPDAIEVDITHLDMGDSVHVNEVKFPAGVEIPHGSDFTIVTIVAPREEEAAPVVAAATEAGVPAAEGTQPAAGAPGQAPAPAAEGKAVGTGKAEKGK